MEDDGQESSGSSGFAWYALGRMSARSAQKQSEAWDSLFGRAPVPVETYNQVVSIAEDWRAQCLRLRQINADLVAQLNASNKYAAELKTWGQAVDEHRDRLQEGYDGQRQLTLTYLKRGDRLQDEVDRLTGNL